jgi:hypothetical protein
LACENDNGGVTEDDEIDRFDDGENDNGDDGSSSRSVGITADSVDDVDVVGNGDGDGNADEEVAADLEVDEVAFVERVVADCCPTSRLRSANNPFTFPPSSAVIADLISTFVLF